MGLRASARLLGIALVSACGARPPIDAPAAPRLDAGAIAQARPPLAVAGVVLTHQVAIEMPGRSEVMIGRMSFPSADTFRLEAETPFGMGLFSVGWDGARYTTEVAPPLVGRFPAEALARDIHRLYFSRCGADAVLAESDSREVYVLECTLAGGARVEERLEVARLVVVDVKVVDPGGRVTFVSYRDYREHSGVLHPQVIEMRSEKFRVKIALTALSRS